MPTGLLMGGGGGHSLHSAHPDVNKGNIPLKATFTFWPVLRLCKELFVLRIPVSCLERLDPQTQIRVKLSPIFMAAVSPVHGAAAREFPSQHDRNNLGTCQRIEGAKRGSSSRDPQGLVLLEVQRFC